MTVTVSSKSEHKAAIAAADRADMRLVSVSIVEPGVFELGFEPIPTEGSRA